MEEGRWPLTDWCGRRFTQGYQALRAGQKLAGEWTAGFSGIKHDLKAMVQMNQDVRHYGCNNICEECLASKTVPMFFYTNFSEDAPYSFTRVTRNVSELLGDRVDRSPWVAHPDWDRTREFKDLVHIVWLGFAKDLGGSGLWTLAEDGWFGEGNINDRLERAWRKFRIWRRAERVSGGAIKCFTKASLGRDKSSLLYPCIPSHVKGFSCNLLIYFVGSVGFL
jgi:hypothetical protein